jgi:hypothetical protein
MSLLKYLFRKKPAPPVWADEPREAGWYVVYKRGRGMDIIWWSGFEDDPCFELESKAHYFGPFKLPLAL